MTYQNDCTLPEELLEQIAADGLWCSILLIPCDK